MGLAGRRSLWTNYMSKCQSMTPVGTVSLTTKRGHASYAIDIPIPSTTLFPLSVGSRVLHHFSAKKRRKQRV